MKSLLPLLFISLIALFSCDDIIKDPTDETPSPFPTELGRRTVLIYCAAQNSLGYTNYSGINNWTKDSTELAAGKQFIADVDLVVIMVKHDHIKAHMAALADKVVLDCQNICPLPGTYHL